jgi:photosystem II stability/assembly factor-like uncharacterized protein
MWAYLAQGGVFESTDGGVDWRRVSESHIPFVTAVREGDLTVLLGLDPFTGIVRSADGGATWTLVSRPPTSPVVSLSATPDGAIILVGGPDGLYPTDPHGDKSLRSSSRLPSPSHRTGRSSPPSLATPRSTVPTTEERPGPVRRADERVSSGAGQSRIGDRDPGGP